MGTTTGTAQSAAGKPLSIVPLLTLMRALERAPSHRAAVMLLLAIRSGASRLLAAVGKECLRCRCSAPRPAIHAAGRYCERCDGDLPVLIAGPGPWRAEVMNSDGWTTLAVGSEAETRAAALDAAVVVGVGDAVRVLDMEGALRWFAGAPIAPEGA